MQAQVSDSTALRHAACLYKGQWHGDDKDW